MTEFTALSMAQSLRDLADELKPEEWHENYREMLREAANMLEVSELPPAGISLSLDEAAHVPSVSGLGSYVVAQGGWCAPSESFYSLWPPWDHDPTHYPKRRSAIGGQPSRRRLKRRVRKQERELSRVYTRLRAVIRELEDLKRQQSTTSKRDLDAAMGYARTVLGSDAVDEIISKRPEV